MSGSIINDAFDTNQAQLDRDLKDNSLVAVFQLTTHGGKMTLEQDALVKVEEMYRAGIKKFEFLLRGDDTMPLDTQSALGQKNPELMEKETYVGQVMDIIHKLDAKYRADPEIYQDAVANDKNVKFGVGTISSANVMKQVVANKDIDFIMTAHWPKEFKEILGMAAASGKPILTTVTGQDIDIVPKGKGEVINPVKPKGGDTLRPEMIAELREAGIKTFKASDFSQLATTRAHNQSGSVEGNTWESLAEQSALTRSTFGLIAIAEAIRDSYADGQVPANETFTVGTTGGVKPDTLPFIAGSVKNPKVRAEIKEILDDKAQPIIDILERTTIGAGGTFVTEGFNTIIKEAPVLTDDVLAQAKKALYKTAKSAVDIAKAATRGEELPEIALSATGS